ncbi:hypothetical protein ACIHCX_37180, partial [Streptomyces sp. NPDC052043]|uniref:hypothetical protein n=1 Tax=Streptomyces sp. NPDC052043 TaxID=3365684 RepID=UPI0037CE62B2
LDAVIGAYLAERDHTDTGGTGSAPSTAIAVDSKALSGSVPVFMVDRVPGRASLTARSERPCTGLNETGTETARSVAGPSRELRDLLIRRIGHPAARRADGRPL